MRSSRIVLLAVGVVVLAGCNPITLDYGAHRAASKATGAITPTTMVVNGVAVNAVDIVTRDCTHFRLTNVPGPRGPVNQDLPRARPTAIIRDRSNKVVFNNLYKGAAEPGNAQVVYANDGDHLRIPVQAFTPPLTIEAGCTTFPGGPPGVGLTWYLEECFTHTRSCESLKGGRIALVPNDWVWSH